MGEWAAVYDDCNVLCLAGWEAEKETVQGIVSVWLQAEYDGDEDRRKMLETFEGRR